MKFFKLTDTSLLLLTGLVIVLLILLLVNKKKKQENFSFGSIFGKIKNVATGAFGTVKNVVKPPGFSATFANRIWNGRTWECPDGTIDYGKDDKQCLASLYGPQVWRWTGSDWGWGCPEGTVPNNSDEWDQKCIAGYSGRKLIGGQWRCTDTEIDTGKTWDNSDWFTAQQSCKRNNTVFTTRMNIDNKWQCPPGTTDTGFNWGDGANGGKQCQYIGG